MEIPGDFASVTSDQARDSSGDGHTGATTFVPTVQPLSGLTNLLIEQAGPYSSARTLRRYDGMLSDDDEEEGTGRGRRKRRRDDEESAAPITYEPIPYKELRGVLADFEIATNSGDIGDECWACEHSVLVKLNPDNKLPPSYQMIAVTIKNALFRLSLQQIARKVKDIFDKDIKPTLRDGEDWPLTAVWTHITKHMHDPAIYIKVSLEEWQTIYEVLKNKVIKRDVANPTTITFDMSVLKGMVLVSEQIKRLYAVSTEKSSAFSWDLTPVSMAKNFKGSSGTKMGLTSKDLR